MTTAATATLVQRGRRRVDRTPKSCLHKQANHQHGTRTCYVLDRCRCMPCTEANRAYAGDRARQHAYGRWDHYVDAEPARQHVRNLTARGMGLKRIVAVGGASQGMLWKLMYGKTRPDGSRAPSKRITKASAERILTTELDLAGGTKVDGLGTTRRVQALVTCGWSQSRIAARLGMLRSNLGPIAHGGSKVSVTTAKAVRDLYEELWNVDPPEEIRADKAAASRARNYAKTNGWLAPMWWDDIDTDLTPSIVATTSPDHGLDEAAIWRRMHGDHVRVTKAEAAEVVNRLRAEGVPYQHIVQRTGLKPERYSTEGTAA